MQTLTVENIMEQGFYVRRGIAEALKLSDTERDIYSVIYSFTKNKEAGAYVGRQSYLAELTSRSEAAVSRALKSLIAKGFVTKICYTDHKERRTAYSADLELAARLIKQHVDEVNRAQAEEQSGENAPKLGIRGENDQATAAQKHEASDNRTESYAASGSVAQRSEFSDKHSGSYTTSGSAVQRSEFSDKRSESYATYRPRVSSTRVDPDYANEALRLALERSYGSG